MINDKFKMIPYIFCLALGLINIAYATTSPTIEFFVSNNREEISIEKAYERLSSEAQHKLKDNSIILLQKNHIEQGRFENILGTYEMVSDKKTTGDNTEIFHVSPLQSISQDQIFSLAGQLANRFQQESVAVFIPSTQSTIATISVKFLSHKPTITEAIKLIRDKLPAYANAFSLQISATHSKFNTATVTKILWLGSKVNIDKVKKAFPQEDISYDYGQAYLVYKNGQIKLL